MGRAGRQSREVARRENAALSNEDKLSNADIFHEDGTIKQNILLDMASNAFLKESQDLCVLIQQETTRRIRFKDRGVDQAGFYVMLNTQALMPSILFEAGFLSNKVEEKQLRRNTTQQLIAEGLFRAIEIFKERHERDLTSLWNNK